MSFAPFLSEKAGETKLVALSRDITERSQAESGRRAGARALPSLDEDLERQVAERTAALRLSRDIIASSAAPTCAFDTAYGRIAFNQSPSDGFFRGGGQGDGPGPEPCFRVRQAVRRRRRRGHRTRPGTTFTLCLPEVDVAPDQRPEVDREAEAGSPLGMGQSLLVVEDNVEAGRLAAQIREDLGDRTTWAANAEDALDKLGADGAGFDAVLSDVVMPGMGGIALAKSLRRRFPGLPVLLASGYSHVLARDGVEGFELLHKPSSVEQPARILRHPTTKRADDLGADLGADRGRRA